MPTIDVNPTADITVALCGHKEGKKNGYLKDESGQFYSVPLNLLPQFSKGIRCKVEYKTFGDDGRSITKLIGNGASMPGPKNDYRARANPTEDKANKVSNWTAAWIARVPADEMSEDRLLAIVGSCMRVYDKTLGGTQAQRRDDLNDSIEY